MSVTIGSISDENCIKCSRDVKICADAKLSDVKSINYNAVILPGGVGWKNLAAVSIYFSLSLRHFLEYL